MEINANSGLYLKIYILPLFSTEKFIKYNICMIVAIKDKTLDKTLLCMTRFAHLFRPHTSRQP